jgi:cytochrome P450
VQKTTTSYHFPAGRNQWQTILNSVSFLKNPIRVISQNMSRYGGTYSAALMSKRKFILTEDPEFIEYVLRDNHTNYQKSELSAKTAARLFGNGLLFSNGEFWLKQRRLIQPAFHLQKIQGLQQIVAKTVQEVVAEFPTGERLDAYALMQKLSFTVLIKSLFDIDLSFETATDLSRGFTDLQDFLLKEINQPYRKLFYRINHAERKIIHKARKIKSILRGIIDQRRSSLHTYHDLLDMIIHATYENGEKMGEEQIIDEILVLLFAGHETTANTISWLLYLLATHPGEVVKLRASIASISIFESPKDSAIQAAISEAMRLYPAAWMTDRVALQDDHFGPFSYPKGTIIIPFIFGLHRNKMFWKNEGRFDPDRFMFSDPAQRKKVKNFFPFGAGPRMCIGNNFAMTELAFILYEMLKNFEISPTGDIPAMWPLITLRPKNLFVGLKRLTPPIPEPFLSC